MNLLLADAVPTDLLTTILSIVVGLVVAAVCWIASTVVRHGELLAGLSSQTIANNTSRDSACMAHKAELDRRMTDARTDNDRRFGELTDALKAIDAKLDRALAAAVALAAAKKE